jgi:hypothetical protein
MAASPASIPSPNSASQIPATREEFLTAVRQAESLAQGLQTELEHYRKHLRQAMDAQDYHPYRLIRSGAPIVNQAGFDEWYDASLARAAGEVKRHGKSLTPDPFVDWARVQNYMQAFQRMAAAARSLTARTQIVDARHYSEFPLDDFRSLTKRWRSALHEGAEAWLHANSVRPDRSEDKP